MPTQREPEAKPACPLCLRPNYHPSDHHFVPKSCGGKVTRTICRDCHSAIHALFPNKDLARTYHTPEALLSHEPFRRMLSFISRQDPGGRLRIRPPKARSSRRA